VESARPDPDLSDEDLLLAARNGNSRAFETIFRRHERRLLKIAYGLLLDWDDAQDAMQSAFIAIYRCLTDLDVSRPGAVRAYLITCARNAAFDALRKGRPWDPMNSDVISKSNLASPGSIEELVREAEYVVLRECIRQLRPKERLVIVLRFPGNLPDAEVWKLLKEMGWSDVDAAETLAAEEEKKIREIVNYTRSLGINTVGGVGNILKAAKRKLKECFEHDGRGTASSSRGSDHE